MVPNPKNQGFVSTKALMGLAGAGALSLLWWVSGTDDSLDTEIQPLFEEVTTSDFVLEFIGSRL